MTKERLDVLDEQGRKTGKIIQRGQRLKENDYILSVHIYIYNKEGKYLIQKRSGNKDILPGIWEVTLGTVQSGEDSMTAAVREVHEELGINLDENKMSLAGRVKGRHYFADLWFAGADFKLTDCVLQKEEVEDVKLVTPDDLMQLLIHAEHRNDEYRTIVKNMLMKTECN